MLLRITTEPQEGSSYETLRRLAVAAEDAGFDGFFRSDHLMTGTDDRGRNPDGLPGSNDAWLTLAGLALQTSRLRLGTLMTAGTFRLPGPLAVAVAQVDVMSGGRVELGLGAGWYEAEHAAYGIPFPPVTERFDRLAEQVELLTGIWATEPGDTYTYEGRYYRLLDCPALPRPVQRPHPPVILGGLGAKRTPALAARFATEYNVPDSTPLDVARRQYERVRAACAAIGRDPASVIFSAAVTICCGADDREVQARAAAIGIDAVKLEADSLVGSPARVLDRLGDYAAIGARRIYLQVLDLQDLDHIELLASQVLPAARDL